MSILLLSRQRPQRQGLDCLSAPTTRSQKSASLFPSCTCKMGCSQTGTASGPYGYPTTPVPEQHFQPEQCLSTGGVRSPSAHLRHGPPRPAAGLQARNGGVLGPGGRHPSELSMNHEASLHLHRLLRASPPFRRTSRRAITHSTEPDDD